MDVQDEHAVVTGGGSGIGRAITTALREAGASVLIVGRDRSRLDAVASEGTGITVLVADLATQRGRDLLVDQVLAGAPGLDVLVNCAVTMSRIDLRAAPAAGGAFDQEIALDLTAPVHLTTALLAHLLARPQAAVVNVTTGLVHALFGDTPAHSTAKAGLRAFTQALRWQTRDSQLQVLEVQPPTVDTDLVAQYGGPKSAPQIVGQAVVQALRSGKDELRVGQAKALGVAARLAPATTYRLMNTAAEKTLPPATLAAGPPPR